MITAALLLFANSLLLSLRLSGGGSFPRPLTAAEEQACLERYAKGDQEARNLLIEHNLRLVAHIVKKYYTQTGDQEDLISIGTIGLIKAVGSFDPTKGIRLATYAARCIENAILPPMRLSLPMGNLKRTKSPNGTFRTYQKGSRCPTVQGCPPASFFADAMTASNSSSFCLEGQGRFWMRRLTSSAWIPATRRAKSRLPSSVLGS
jgi:hypothetical protein